jgi:hypothetical protein
MSGGYLDPNSYTFAGGFPIQRNRDLILPADLPLTQTMLVRWTVRQMARGVTLADIPPALISTTLEIPGFGVLNTSDLEVFPSGDSIFRVALINLDPSLPHKIKFHEVDGDLVTNSILELYTSNILMSQLNNPVNTSTDLSPIITALSAASAAEVAAMQQQIAATTRAVQSIEESVYTAAVWSNIPANHIVASPNPRRMRVELLNTGNRPIGVDLFTDISQKANTPQYDGVIAPGGTYQLDLDQAGLGILLYALAPGGTATVNVQLSK